MAIILFYILTPNEFVFEAYKKRKYDV